MPAGICIECLKKECGRVDCDCWCHKGSGFE